MEGINHSSRERHSWSDRGGVKRDKNVLSPFGSQGTLPWPPRSSPPPTLPNRAFSTEAHHASSSRRPLCPLAALHYSATSITARLTTEEFDVAATARHRPYVPLPSPCSFSVSPRGGQPSTGLSSRGIDGRKGRVWESSRQGRPSIRIYLSIRGARSDPPTFPPRFPFHFPR